MEKEQPAKELWDSEEEVGGNAALREEYKRGGVQIQELEM